MGSCFNVRIKWEKIAATNLITCALYLRENSLINEPGWIRLQHLANCEKQLPTPLYKFGYPMSCTYECFKGHGIYGKDLPPERYKKIRVHLIVDVKHDLTASTLE